MGPRSHPRRSGEHTRTGCSVRIVTDAGMNRAVLARQSLLERSTASIPRMLEKVGGLQTQYAPSGYIGLFARIEGFDRDSLTRALARRTVIQATLMRATIHMVSRRDFLLFSAGVRQSRQEWWLRAARDRGLHENDYRQAARLVHRALAGGPRPRRDLIDLLADHGFPKNGFEGVGLFVDLVRVPPSGTWERRRADLYQTADEWIGPNPHSDDEGLRHLVRRYLRAFGPTPLADLATWTQVPSSRLEPVVDGLRLNRMTSEHGDTLLDVRGGLLPEGSVPAPVRFLPTWDANLLVHVRRAGILRAEHRPIIFSTKNPQSVGTFLVDGVVAGTWKFDGSIVTTDPFDPLTRKHAREVEEEAARLTAFMR